MLAPRWYPITGVLALASFAAVLVISQSAGNGPSELLQYYGSQPQLMDEGSISMDPNTEDAAKEFFRMNEESTQTDDDVPDAGPGHILGGWTHPELVNPPDPAELQSFQDPSDHGAVYNPSDYSRTPGAVETVENSRSSIAALQDQIQASHAEAEEAKQVYEAENAKSQQLQAEYLNYVRSMQQAKRRYGRPYGANQATGGLNMWAPNARAPDFDNKNAQQPTAAPQSNEFIIDKDTPDAAAVYRKQFYAEAANAQPTLTQVRSRPYIGSFQRTASLCLGMLRLIAARDPAGSPACCGGARHAAVTPVLRLGAGRRGGSPGVCACGGGAGAARPERQGGAGPGRGPTAARASAARGRHQPPVGVQGRPAARDRPRRLTSVRGARPWRACGERGVRASVHPARATAPFPANRARSRRTCRRRARTAAALGLRPAARARRTPVVYTVRCRGRKIAPRCARCWRPRRAEAPCSRRVRGWVLATGVCEALKLGWGSASKGRRRECALLSGAVCRLSVDLRYVPDDRGCGASGQWRRASPSLPCLSSPPPLPTHLRSFSAGGSAARRRD